MATVRRSFLALTNTVTTINDPWPTVILSAENASAILNILNQFIFEKKNQRYYLYCQFRVFFATNAKEIS